MRPDQIFSLGILLTLFGIVLLGLSQVEQPPMSVSSPEVLSNSSQNEEPPDTTEGTVYYGVERVVDGDTIIVQGLLDSIRLIGIDTPELKDSRPQLRCLAQEATERLEDIVGAKEVILEPDIEDRDRYRRFLRYVFLPDGTFVNLLLVREGYAKILTYPPNVRYAALFYAAQQEARLAQRGLWDPNTCR